MSSTIEIEQQTRVVCDFDATQVKEEEWVHQIANAGGAETCEATPSLLALSSRIAAAQDESRFGAQTRRNQHSRPALMCKRALDVIGAVLLLVISSPLLFFCAAVVFCSSPGPVLFKHRRLGRGGTRFFVWKFRTMCTNADGVLARHLEMDSGARMEWSTMHKLSNDPRVFAAGRLMRRLSIDELPQLWNVLKGEMSLIGPRPIVEAEAGRYGGAIGAYFAVRPGMTGLWQVSGRSNVTYAERVKLDQQYVHEWSLALDAKIFVNTFKVLLTAEGAC